MEEYAHLVAGEVEVVVAFSWCGAVAAGAGSAFGAEVCGEVEVLYAGEDDYISIGLVSWG